jgi:hypothetical protein
MARADPPREYARRCSARRWKLPQTHKPFELVVDRAPDLGPEISNEFEDHDRRNSRK